MMMPIRRSQRWLPGIFNDFFDTDWMEKANATAPAINVFECEDSYKLDVAAPGLTKEDFNVKVDDDNNLVIAMEKSNKEEKEEQGCYLRREFSYSKFEQRIILPDNINHDGIHAEVKNGVLSIEIPKISEEEIQKNEKLIEVN